MQEGQVSNNLTNKALKGMSWSYLSVIASAGSQIIIGAIMARLLTPADFGIIAISNIVLRFGQYFSQLGMTAAVIQKKDLSHKDMATAHNLAMLTGLIVTLIFLGISPLLGRILDNSNVLPVIQVMSLTFVLTGFGIVSGALLRRNMRFKFIAISDVLSYLISYGIGIILAYNGNGVWALVSAMLLQQLLRSLMNYAAARHSIVPFIFKDSFKSLLSYGGRSSLIGFLEFLYCSLDTFFIGKFLGATSLGLFNRVKIVVDLPLNYMSSNLVKVLFPLFCNLNAKGDIKRLRNGFLDALLLLTIILMPLTVLVSTSAELIIAVLLGDQWSNAILQARIIPFASYFGLTAMIFGSLFDARGLLTRKLWITFCLLITLSTGYLLLRPFNSLNVYTLLLVSGSLMLLCSNAFWLGKDFKIPIRSYINIIAEGLLISTPIAVVSLLFTELFIYFDLNVFISLPLVWMIAICTAVLWFINGPFSSSRKVINDRVLKPIVNKLPEKLAKLIVKYFFDKDEVKL